MDNFTRANFFFTLALLVLLVTNIMSANTVHLHSQLCSCIHLFCINILSHRWQILDCIVLNSDASQSSPVKYPDFLHQHYDVQLRPNLVHRGSQLCSGTKAASSFYASTLWWSTEVKYSASIQSRCIQLFCINIPTPCPMSRPRPHIGLETDAVWSTSSSWIKLVFKNQMKLLIILLMVSRQTPELSPVSDEFLKRSDTGQIKQRFGGPVMMMMIYTDDEHYDYDYDVMMRRIYWWWWGSWGRLEMWSYSLFGGKMLLVETGGTLIWNHSGLLEESK